MTPLPHHYEVTLSGGPTEHATLSTAGAPELRAAPPVEFDGPGDAWSPEHLLLAAVQTCFLFTLRAIARAAAMSFISLDVVATGTVNRADGVTRFTEIVLRLRIVVARGTDRDRVLTVLAKSERHCLVSASLSTPIRVESDVATG